MRSAAVGFQCPSCVAEGAKSIRQPKAVFGGKVVESPTVTYTLIGLNVLVFLVTTATGAGFAFGGGWSRVFEKLALTPTVHCTQIVDGLCQSIGPGVAQGEYYRLLTSTFLHYGVIHIALNMYLLFLLGPTLEAAFGRLRFALLYLLSGLSGAATSYALGPANEQAAGASGAIFGLFAAFYVVQRRHGGDVTPILTTIGINLAISFAASSFIDWRGHVGGLLGGALVAAGLVYAPAGRTRWVYQAVACVAVAVVIVAVVVVRTAELTSSLTAAFAA